MFSKLPNKHYIEEYFIEELPTRKGIWRLKKPFYVMSRLFDRDVLVGYVLYDRRNRHCFPVSRILFVHAVVAKQVKHVRFTCNGLESCGDFILECIPYHEVNSKNRSMNYEHI